MNEILGYCRPYTRAVIKCHITNLRGNRSQQQVKEYLVSMFHFGQLKSKVFSFRFLGWSHKVDEQTAELIMLKMKTEIETVARLTMS